MICAETLLRAQELVKLSGFGREPQFLVLRRRHISKSLELKMKKTVPSFSMIGGLLRQGCEKILALHQFVKVLFENCVLHSSLQEGSQFKWVIILAAEKITHRKIGPRLVH